MGPRDAQVLVAKLTSESFAGPLPDPAKFAQFPESAQKEILRWASEKHDVQIERERREQGREDVRLQQSMSMFEGELTLSSTKVGYAHRERMLGLILAAVGLGGAIAAVVSGLVSDVDIAFKIGGALLTLLLGGGYVAQTVKLRSAKRALEQRPEQLRLPYDER